MHCPLFLLLNQSKVDKFAVEVAADHLYPDGIAQTIALLGAFALDAVLVFKEHGVVVWEHEAYRHHSLAVVIVKLNMQSVFRHAAHMSCKLLSYLVLQKLRLLVSHRGALS